MKKISPTSLVPLERIQGSILLIRGKRVMLDSDLARLYGVSTKRLNEQVKRNKDRFPEDFMFQLNKIELKDWRLHFATSNPARTGTCEKRLWGQPISMPVRMQPS